MDELPVKCFQHCERTRNIVCFSVPLQCPLCGQDTRQTECRIPPYIVPSPFVCAESVPCSLVIKPTHGSFLRDFTNSSNLHVGLTDSQGTVSEYDEAGVCVGRPGWTQCVPVQILAPNIEKAPQWDLHLQSYHHSSAWTKERYHEDKYNCFDFVVDFLRTFGLIARYPSLASRLEFCREVIVPRTDIIGRFISLYRDIERNGFVIQDSDGS